jgi:hypothetical protein
VSWERALAVISALRIATVFWILTFAVAANAQAPADCPTNSTEPSIHGVYVDNFGGLQAVSTPFWVSGNLVFGICSIDNTQHFLIARNSLRNAFNPGKYSRFEWTTFGNRLWYCQSVFDAASASAAASAARADPSDPVNKGCGTFAWSTLIHLPQ